MRFAASGILVLSLVAAARAAAPSDSTQTQEPQQTSTATTTTTTTTATATSTQPPAPKDSALVRAAKQSGTKNKIPKKALTNEDVRKSKGKLTTTSPKPIPATTSTPVDTRSSFEQADARLQAKKSAAERLATAQKKFDALEKDLAAVEQSYYEEKDINARDTIIQKRFAQTKRQLDEARKELADARDAVSALSPKQ